LALAVLSLALVEETKESRRQIVAPLRHRLTLLANNLSGEPPLLFRFRIRFLLGTGWSPRGLIVSSSNTIHRGVKPENYRAMLNALRRYGTYPDLARQRD
jgi:hypothetical protein